MKEEQKQKEANAASEKMQSVELDETIATEKMQSADDGSLTETMAIDDEVLEKQLLNPCLLQLWRTGALDGIYHPDKEEDNVSQYIVHVCIVNIT